jgi:hypothetical protein
MNHSKTIMLAMSDLPAPFPGCTQMHALYQIDDFDPVNGIVTIPCYPKRDLSEELDMNVYPIFPHRLYHKRTRIFDRNEALVEEHNSYFSHGDDGWHKYTKNDLFKMLESAYENR